MLRLLLPTVLVGFALTSAGCQDAQPVGNPNAAAPPVPAVPTVSSVPGSPPIPAVPPAVATNQGTPPGSGTITPPTVAPGVGTVTLAVAHGNLEQASLRLVDVLKSVQDDASAAAAAPRIPLEARQVADAMQQVKTVVATMSLNGQKPQVDAFYQQEAEKLAAKGGPPEAELLVQVERIVNSPQGLQLRTEINGLLDTMLAAGTSGTRRGLERAIEQKKLRR